MMSKYSDTQKAILDASKQEFLKKGYKDANLRSIAAQAGVTTGAIYGYFMDKHELFRALVEPEATDFFTQFEQAVGGFSNLPEQEQIESMHSYSSQQLNHFFDYIYDHFDVFRLIKSCSSGTEYEGYIDKMVDVETRSTRLFIELLKEKGFCPAPISDNLSHILANAFFSTIFEVVEHKMERQEAKAYIDHITRFFSAGWDTLLKFNE